MAAIANYKDKILQATAIRTLNSTPFSPAYVKPSQVTNFAVSTTPKQSTEGMHVIQADLSWDASPDVITGYIAYFNVTGSPDIQTIKVKDNFASFDIVPAGQSYDMLVTAVNVNEESIASPIIVTDFLIDTVAPSPPSLLTADVALGTITLNWTNPTDDDFNQTWVYVSETNDKATATILVKTSSDSYTFNDTEAGTVRYFWLVAYDFSGNMSAQYPISDTAGIDVTSASTYVYTKPDIPANLALTETVIITQEGASSITGTAAWDDIASEYTTFRLRISENGSTVFAYFDTTALFFQFLNVQVGNVYEVWVKALNQTEHGDYSASQTITITGDVTPPSPPTNLAITSGGGDATITWVNPTDNDFSKTEILASLVNDRSTAVVIDSISGSRLYYDNLIAGDVWYVWSRSCDYSKNFSDYHPLSATGGVSVTISARAAEDRIIGKFTDLGSVASGTITPDFDANTNMFKLTLTGAGVTINPPTITLGSGDYVDGRIQVYGGDSFQPIWGAGWNWGDDGEPELMATSLIGYTQADGDIDVAGWQYGRTTDSLLKFV